jgi:hypothetical protein
MASFEEILGDILAAATSDKAVEIVGLVGSGLDTLETMTSNPAVATAAALAAGVKAVLGAIRDGVTGTVDVDAVRAELAKLAPAIAGNDAAADQALAAKFPAGE